MEIIHITFNKFKDSPVRYRGSIQTISGGNGNVHYKNKPSDKRLSTIFFNYVYIPLEDSFHVSESLDISLIRIIESYFRNQDSNQESKELYSNQGSSSQLSII